MLGHGNYGRVTEVKYAKKATETQYAANAIRELNFLATLKGVNGVPKLLDAERTPAGIDIIMEKINISRGSIDCESMLNQALIILSALKKFYILHLDIKAGNLVCDVDGKCWLIDYGLSMYQFSEYTQFKPFGYHPPYYKNCDGFSIDVWSLGLTIFDYSEGYHLLPYTGDLNKSLVAKKAGCSVRNLGKHHGHLNMANAKLEKQLRPLLQVNKDDCLKLHCEQIPQETSIILMVTNNSVATIIDFFASEFVSYERTKYFNISAYVAIDMYFRYARMTNNYNLYNVYATACIDLAQIVISSKDNDITDQAWEVVQALNYLLIEPTLLPYLAKFQDGFDVIKKCIKFQNAVYYSAYRFIF